MCCAGSELSESRPFARAQNTPTISAEHPTLNLACAVVAFLKEQLTATGLVPQALPEGAREQEALKANALLDSLLAQIPSGAVGEYDLDTALSHARVGPQQGAHASTSNLLSKLEMLWAEVRELVATSSAARLSSGDAAPPAAGPQGTPIHSSTKGISNELVIARLRGKVDHLTTTLESSQQALTQAQSQLQNQQHQVASAEDQARLDQVSRDLARANVQKKELEQLLSKSAAEAEEREAQTKQLTVRVQSLAAALQDKEAQAASLSALEKRVQELHLTIQELEPKMVPAQTATKPDAYVSLKALEHVCERLSLGQRQTLQELADVQAKLTAAGCSCVLEGGCIWHAHARARAGVRVCWC